MPGKLRQIFGKMKNYFFIAIYSNYFISNNICDPFFLSVLILHKYLKNTEVAKKKICFYLKISNYSAWDVYASINFGVFPSGCSEDDL